MAVDLVMFDGEKLELGFKQVFNTAGKLGFRIMECSEEDIRAAVEQKKAELILISERNPKDAMHFRRTALDEFICSLAAKNNIAFAFSFSDILNARNRPLIIGRIMQNIRMCRKHKVRMIFASFAANKWEMRAPEELRAFARTMGMTAKEAMDSVDSAIETANSKKEKIKGVKILD